MKSREISRFKERDWKNLGNTKSASSAPVIGALRSVSKGFDKWIEMLDIQCTFIDMQKTILLGTASILGKVLEV